VNKMKETEPSDQRAVARMIPAATSDLEK
jgi:hypothetical protein